MTKKARIGIDRLHVVGIIGIFPEERQVPQSLFIDIAIEVDAELAIKTDNFSHAIDYTALAKLCQDTVDQGNYFLIETLASALVDKVLSDYEIEEVTVKVCKPQAIPHAQSTWCEIYGRKRK